MPAHHPRAHDDSQSNARPRRATFPQDARTPSHATRGTSLAFAITACVLILVSALPSGGADMGNATTSYNAAPPAFGAGGDTTVPASVAMRNVYGSLTLSPTALSAANVTISICGGAVLENFNVPQISGATETLSYAFTVTGGDCYRFNNNLDPSAANRIASYNYVDVANESFESRAHANATWCPLSCGTDNDSAYETLSHAVASRAEMNATSAATYCALTDCANNTYLNETIRPPLGVAIRFYAKDFAGVVATYDPNSTRAGDDIHFIWTAGSDIITGTPGQIAFTPTTCIGTLQVWAESPSGSETSRRSSVEYDCDAAHNVNDIAQVTGLSAQSGGGTVHLAWATDESTTDGFFQIEGNASTAEPRQLGSYYLIGGTPFYGPLSPSARSIDVPLSDFATNPTYLDAEFWANGTQGSIGQTMSCEVNFTADGALHACGTLAPAPATNVTTFVNQTYVNQTFENATEEQFLPVIFNPHGNMTVATFDENGSLTNTPTHADGSPDQLGQEATCCVRSDSAPLFMDGNDSETRAFAVDDGATEPRVWTAPRAGLLRNMTVEAYGPMAALPGCNVGADFECFAPLTLFGYDGTMLTVSLVKNNVTVASGTWASGEAGFKDIISTPIQFAQNDEFQVRMNATFYDGCDTGCGPGTSTHAGLWNYLAGVQWNNGTSTSGPDDDSAYATWSFVNATSGGASDFFGSPFVQLLPYVSVLFLILMAFVSLEGFVTNLVTTVLALLLTFGVALSKTRIDDGIAPYATIILGTGFVLMSALMALKLVRPGINKL